MIKSISPQEAKRLIDKEGAILIDIREPEEFAGEHITGARSVPLSVFTSQPPVPDSKRSVIFYCRSGARTRANTATLEKNGFAAAYYIEGGLMAWKNAGLRV